MERRYFENPYEDYAGQEIHIDEGHIRDLIKSSVTNILKHTKDDRSSTDARGDLYVGDAGNYFTLFYASTVNWIRHFCFVCDCRYCVHVSSSVSKQ